jgi:hypothetical protein
MDYNYPLCELDRVKIFLSYSTIDKHTAATIKYYLEKLGFDIFLAHNDLEPSQIWIEEILKHLDNCDIFLPFLTDNCRNSTWVNQEIGIEFTKNKIIIPLTVNCVPWGFISHIQAYSLNASNNEFFINDIENASWKIEKIMKEKTYDKMRDSLIFALNNSSSYDISNKISISLLHYMLSDPDHVNEIIRIFLMNDQVNQAYDARKLISRLFNDYGDSIDPEFEHILIEEWDFQINKLFP